MLQEACKRPAAWIGAKSAATQTPLEVPSHPIRLGAGGETGQSKRVSPRKASILAYCRVLGWLMAAVILVFAAVEIETQVRLQGVRSEVSKREFLDRVRACRHQKRKPVPSWEACEMIARAAE
jgi:hypothetical protein